MRSAVTPTVYAIIFRGITSRSNVREESLSSSSVWSKGNRRRAILHDVSLQISHERGSRSCFNFVRVVRLTAARSRDRDPDTSYEILRSPSSPVSGIYSLKLHSDPGHKSTPRGTDVLDPLVFAI